MVGRREFQRWLTECSFHPYVDAEKLYRLPEIEPDAILARGRRGSSPRA